MGAAPAMLAWTASLADATRARTLRLVERDELTVADRALDAAVCLALHHQPDPAAVLRQAARVLRPGGRLLVIDMLEHGRREYQQQMGHVWLGFARAQVTAWLGEARFDHARVQPLPPAPQAAGPALFAATARRRTDVHPLHPRRAS